MTAEGVLLSAFFATGRGSPTVLKRDLGVHHGVQPNHKENTQPNDYLGLKICV